MPRQDVELDQCKYVEAEFHSKEKEYRGAASCFQAFALVHHRARATDMLMVFTGLFLLCFLATMGVLMFRLLYLPQSIIPREQKAKYEVVATLCLIAMFTPGNFFWIAAVLVAMADIPEYTPLLQRIAGAIRRMAQAPKRKEEAPPLPEKSRQQRAV